MQNLEQDYLKPRFSFRNLDIFGVRRAIVEAVKASLPDFSGTVLDVGCGYQPYKSLLTAPPSQVTEYIGMDLATNHYGQPDITWDGQNIPLPDESVDSVIATEFLEHSPEPQKVLSEICRVLKPNGFFFFTVPFFWPLHEVPNDYYRFTPFSLEQLLRKAGFYHINVKAHGGWDASLAQMLGLWAKRRPMHPILRGLAVFLTAPAVFLLSRRDPPLFYTESSMATGFYGAARKVSL